jgi:hypothetical protein
MWWHKHTDPEKPLREQLTDAREALINQIAILDLGPLRGAPGEAAQFRAQAAELRDMLSEIEAQLSSMETPNA